MDYSCNMSCDPKFNREWQKHSGNITYGTADRPPGAFEASTPVATMVIKIAKMMETKST